MIFITRIHGKYFKCVIIMSKSLIDWIEIGICVKLISSEQSVTKYYAVLNKKNKNKIQKSILKLTITFYFLIK